jgi:hypothetical protein
MVTLLRFRVLLADGKWAGPLLGLCSVLWSCSEGIPYGASQEGGGCGLPFLTLQPQWTSQANFRAFES